ncbi:MAG: MOSC domain-containing protein YiiM [Cryomorphaceae bacterium]|jgi:MOSC domain-containing protein YiiM
MSQTGSLQELFDRLPQVGRVRWIGLRPARRETIVTPNDVQADTQQGLIGDRYAGSSGKRQVTLIQWEHLPAIASILGLETLDPALLRRNISVSGINLLGLKGKQFQIGEALLEYTGLCHPCSFMESTFGPGSYNAVRGHGGVTARVLSSGRIALTDSVSFVN